MTEITTKYTLDFGDTFQKLDAFAEQIATTEKAMRQNRSAPVYEAYAKSAGNFNKVLGQQIQLYRQQQAQTNSLGNELKLIRSEYAALAKRQQEFIAAGKYEELRLKLKALEARLGEINKLLGGASEGVKKVGQNSSDLASLWGRLKGAALATFAVDQIVEVGKAIVETTAKFEKYEAVLTNALGSRSGAQQALEMIANYAAETPFSVDELTSSFIKFTNRGLIPTKEQLTNIGDLAASQGKSFDQLTEAVLDAQSGEFERLKEFGIKASKSGDQVTLSFKGVEKTVKATSGAITEAVLGFGKLNGVAGSTAVISQTLEGAMSNFGDQVDRLEVSIGSTRLGGAFKALVTAGGELLGIFTQIIAKSPADSLREQQSELNGLVGAIALANDNEAVRLSLIQQLSQKYPEFLGQLDAESVSNDILAQRLAAVNAQYEKKIRIALGQEKITKVNDELTNSIRSQSKALQDLALASGKSITDLEKMDGAQRLALARRLASGQEPISKKAQDKNMTASYFEITADVLERTGQKQVGLQKELNTLLGENAVRQADLTKTTVEGYQKDIAQVREKIRLKKIDKKLGEEEIKRLEAQIRQTQGLAAKPPITKTTTSNKAKPDTKKALDEEKELLLKASEEYLKEYKALEDQYGKARLEILQKDSIEYLQEKAKLDLDEINQARDKYEKLLQLAASNKTQVVNGKRVVVPDASITLEQADPEAAKKFAFLTQQVAVKFNQDLHRLEIDNRIKMLGLERKYNELEIAEAQKKWDELIRLETDAKTKQRLMRLKDKELDRILLGQSIDQVRGQETAQIAFYGQQRFENQLRAENPNDSYLEIERKRQEAILQSRIDFNQRLIDLLKAQGEAENAILIAQTQEMVDGLSKQLGELKIAPIATNVWDAIIPFKTKEQADAFKESMKLIGDSINQATQALVEQSNQRIQSLDNEITAKEKQVDEETTRQKEGAANNLAIRRAELEDLKRQKAEEEQIRRKATQVQQALDLASMISSQTLVAQKSIETVVTAMSEQSKLGPIVGVVAAIAAAATILGTILSVRAKVKAMSKMRSGGKLRGPSHEFGGIRGTGTFDDIEVEGAEYVVNRRSTKKHEDLIEQINADDPAGIARVAARYVSRPVLPQHSMPDVVIHRLINASHENTLPDANFSQLAEGFNRMEKRLEAIERHTEKSANEADYFAAGIPEGGVLMEKKGGHIKYTKVKK